MQKLRMIQLSLKLTDPNQIAILNRVALYEVYQEDIPISYVLRWNDIGSQSTIHKRLLELEKLKLIMFDKVIGDARLRFVCWLRDGMRGRSNAA
jgi:hypothetical protein